MQTPLRITTLLSFLIAVIISGCSNNPTPANPEADAVPEAQLAINEWFDARYEEELQFSPINLTFLGRKERNDELGSFSYDAFAKELAWKKQTVEELKRSYDYPSLSPAEQVSYDIWVYQYERMAESEQFFYSGLTFDQMNGIQSFVPTFLINFHRVENADDLRAYIARINDVAPRMREALDIATKSSSGGTITPAFALDGVIEQAQAVITGAPFNANATEDSDIWADIKQEANTLVESDAMTQETADALLAEAKEALTKQFQPAYESIVEWAENEKDKAPKISTGIGDQPNGAAYYKHRLATQTTTDLTADEIHQIGLDEIARLRNDMLAIMQEVKFNGDLAAFFNHVRDGEWNYYPDTDAGREAYITDATAAIDNIKSKLPEFFGLLPKADLVVKRVEAFRERDGAAQHYYPGTPDGSRPGIYYAHLSDMAAMPKNQLEVIAYHEGLPGHHMQISIAQELEDVPQFRTQAGFTAYSEGWGLYSEVLAREIPGTYIDPYNRFGQLTSEIWRAIRLVVDTGLHAKGWTEQQAIDYFMQNSPEPLESVTSEIQRYIVMPGQATSYKIGMLKIQELREKAQASLGAKFDIRAFHDTVLGGGALPLPVLERVVDQWIESVKAAS
ncbi:MAG: DUF885 family protein [Proteobacteria bacterium]|nr:DUF885 family protein [Pseudomonadota bacterium]